ncbi:hypothetical protein Lalb_Chr20g0117261 [Lupinus albus]|uniref:Uncharacterized protein n=1 Tax=Lupinus albus TaxID=3870 RepID=A0A6A4NQU2_LUPAL|nr:hypothetical protein Lalb_Chr20g0117261 [Lupinus albus]
MNTLRNGHIDFLIKITMKEDIIDIKLLDNPSIYGSNGYEKTNGGKLDHMSKSLIVL